MSEQRIVLGDNQYGKAECRLVRVTRDTPVHSVADLNVTSQLRGDFEAAHTEGDNGRVVATDTQKNTVYAFAREHGVMSPESFLLLLAAHFTGEFDWVTGGRWSAEQYAWDRIVTGDGPHDHAFVRSGRSTRTALVHVDEGGTTVLAGLRDCTVLKSTGSEFHGFPRDRFTTLAGTDDRVLATSVTAWWRYADADPARDHDALHAVGRGAAARHLRRGALAGAPADGARDGRGRAGGSPRDRRDPHLVPQQAPLPGRPRPRSGSTTRARSSSPPTGPTG